MWGFFVSAELFVNLANQCTFSNLDLFSLNYFSVCLFQRGCYHLMTVFKILQHQNVLELRKCLFLHLLKIKSAAIQTNKGWAFSKLFTVWRQCSHIWGFISYCGCEILNSWFKNDTRIWRGAVKKEAGSRRCRFQECSFAEEEVGGKWLKCVFTSWRHQSSRKKCYSLRKSGKCRYRKTIQ